MKNKLFIVITMIIVMILIQFSMLISSVKAETLTGNEGNITWSYDTETETLTFSGSGEIYSKWKDKINYKEVKKIIISQGITSIGENAFYNCINLTSIEIPNSVTEIKKYAFAACGLESLKIPDSITKLNENVFYNSKNLTSIEIPNTVTSISDNAFEFCDKLENIYIDENNQKYISINGVIFNKDVTSIIFYPRGKTNTSYKIPNTVTSIGNNAFYGCRTLSNIELPDKLTSIGNLSFSMCSNLSNIELPNTVKVIGNSVFSYTSLKNIKLPNTLETIGNSAFFNCNGLEKIEIPSTVQSIGSAAFSACASLQSITVNENNQKYSSKDGILFDKDKTKIMCYPCRKDNDNYQIPNTVTVIEEACFLRM